LELRQSEITAQNGRTLSRSELDQAWRARTSEHSDIWIRGNSGEELTPQERLIYENILRDYWSFVGAIAITGERQGIEPRWNPEIVKFAHFLYLNPGAEETWTDWNAVVVEAWAILGEEPQLSFRYETYVREHLATLKSKDQLK